MEEKEIITEVESIQEAVDNTPEVSNETLASYVSDNIHYTMRKDVLIKPLEPIMVKKEFSTPVVKDTVKEEGETINEYDDVKKEIKEVESNFSRGIVLKVPASDTEWDFKVGNIVIYNKRFSVDFDILKNSVLVKPYDIIAIEE